MAEKGDNKEVIYKREVWKIPLKDEKRCLNHPNYDKGIVKETHYLDTHNHLNEIHGKYTEKVVSYKTNTYTSIREENDDYTCEVCYVECSGIENFKQHIDGKKHIKNLKKLNMKSVSEITRLTTYIEKEHTPTDLKESMQFISKQVDQEIMSLKNLKLSELARSAEDESCSKSPVIYCDVCKRHFDSYRIYHHNLDKSEHFENEISMAKLVKTVTVRFEDSSNFSCELCSKSFTGIVPYKQHLMSSLHIRKDNIDKLQKSKKNVTLRSELSCVDCGKEFSSIAQFNDHNKGVPHLKMLKKKHLLAKLHKECPEALKNAMFGEDTKEEKVFDRVIFSETKTVERNCHRGVQQELLRKDCPTQKLHETLSKEEVMQDFDDDSSDDVLIEL